AIRERERRGRKILKLDDAISAAVEKLKARGLTSPYLKPFVVSRVNYTRFSKATSFDYDETLDKIIGSAQKFNVDRVKQEDVAKRLGNENNHRLLTAYGTLYRALGRLEAMGLLESRWEDPHIPARENRPGRRLYVLTAAGETAAQEARTTTREKLPKRTARR